MLKLLSEAKNASNQQLINAIEYRLKNLDENYERLNEVFQGRSIEEVDEDDLRPNFLKEVEKLSKRKISKNNNFIEDGEIVETSAHKITYITNGDPLKKIVRDGETGDIYGGVISNGEHQLEAEELSKIGEGLAKTFMRNNGGLMSRDEFNLTPAYMNRDKNGVTDGPVKGAEYFSLIGGGNEANIYLHEPTGMVYKVYHNASFRHVHVFGSKAKIEKMTAIVKKVEGEYENLDRSSLNNYNMEYLPTYFISSSDGIGNEVPMIVQPYLDPELHTPVSGEFIDSNEAEKMGVNDLYPDNIRMNILTKKIVLFDCIL